MPLKDKAAEAEYMKAYRAANLPRRREWKSANHDAVNDQQKRYLVRLRNEVLDLLGRVCARCGWEDDRVLDIDHIHGDGKAERIKYGPHGSRRFIRNELREGRGRDRYQLLCANCHKIKTYREG